MQEKTLQYLIILAGCLAINFAMVLNSLACDRDKSPNKLFLRIYGAFDSGLVKKWGNVSDFDREFSTDLSRQCALSPGGDGEWVVFDLEKQTPSPRDKEAADAHGWYVAINCDKDGVILDYYLSNSRK